MKNKILLYYVATLSITTVYSAENTPSLEHPTLWEQSWERYQGEDRVLRVTTNLLRQNITDPLILEQFTAWAKKQGQEALDYSGPTFDWPHNRYDSLWNAIEYGNCEVTKALLDAGVSQKIIPTNGFETHLNLAFSPHLPLSPHKRAIASLLMDYSANFFHPTDNNWTPLVASNQEGYDEVSLKIFEKYLAHPDKTLLNQSSNTGETPLSIAVQNELFFDIIPKLLEQGANPNIPNRSGKTPLFYAFMCNDPRIRPLFFKKTEDYHQRDTVDGNTLLHIAAGKRGCPYYVKAILALNSKENPVQKSNQ